MNSPKCVNQTEMLTIDKINSIPGTNFQNHWLVTVYKLGLSIGGPLDSMDSMTVTCLVTSQGHFHGVCSFGLLPFSI